MMQTLEQFQEKCETVFRPELRQNKGLEQFTRFRETVNCSDVRQGDRICH